MSWIEEDLNNQRQIEQDAATKQNEERWIAIGRARDKAFALLAATEKSRLLAKSYVSDLDRVLEIITNFVHSPERGAFDYCRPDAFERAQEDFRRLSELHEYFATFNKAFTETIRHLNGVSHR